MWDAFLAHAGSFWFVFSLIYSLRYAKGRGNVEL